jgi:hypothetical protein
LEAAKIVKKAEGVTGYNFIDFPAKKNKSAKYTDRQGLVKFKETRDVVVIAIPELPVTSIKWRTSPGLAASQAGV